MKKNIVVLPGDGIGPEVVEQAIKTIKAVNAVYSHDFELTYDLIGASAIRQHGAPVSDGTLQQCQNSDAVLLGAIGDPAFDNDPTAKVRPEQGLLKLRKTLSLHTNIRPVNTYEVLYEVSPLKTEKVADVDMTIYRELTGGIYFGEKHLSDDGQFASDLCSYTVEEIERIAVKAFEAAMNRRKKLTLVDKANVLETSRLWRRVVQDIHKRFPEVEVDYMFVDNAAMQVMLNPGWFDVVLTENMFGDIISDLASVITGSLGMLPSASVGEQTAMFEPCHGSYPQAAGKDIANPMATILSIAMMYEYFGLYDEARTIQSAVNKAIKEGIVTSDIDDTTSESCSSVGDRVASYITEKQVA